jgi:hypothetical protein
LGSARLWGWRGGLGSWKDVDDQQHERLCPIVTSGVREICRLKQNITRVEIEVLVDRLLFPLPAITTEYAAGHAWCTAAAGEDPGLNEDGFWTRRRRWREIDPRRDGQAGDMEFGRSGRQLINWGRRDQRGDVHPWWHPTLRFGGRSLSGGLVDASGKERKSKACGACADYVATRQSGGFRENWR